MNIAYLILAHNNPQHLTRLINSLSTHHCAFFVHIDKKANLADFLSNDRDNVFFIQDNVPVYWGDYSMVEAILILLQSALKDSRNFDYFVLLSGSDYPIQPAAYIETFFESKAGTEFMNTVPIPGEKVGKPISRLINYRVRQSGSKVSRRFYKLLRSIGITRKRNYKLYLRDLKPFGGSTWWAITRGAAQYILDFTVSHPQVVNFFKNTYNPDEMFFQTILSNSPYMTSMQRNLMFTDWSAGGAHPAWISDKHLTFFQSTLSTILEDAYGKGELLFARKFSAESKRVVDQLDQLIKEKELIYLSQQ